MARYRIVNTAYGTDLGTYEAGTEDEALDALARDAGYNDYAHANTVAPSPDGEILVERA